MSEKNLNVPYWKSKQSFYCSEASAQMFLEYYGYKLDQDYIHQHADRFEVLLPFLNKYVRTIELIPNKSLIIDSINNKNPIILRIRNKNLHTIVVTGYTTNDFIVHDPDQRANIYIDQNKLLDISEKIILKGEKMSEREDLEKQLADLKRQREEITKQEIPVKQKVPPPAKREAPSKKEKKVSFKEMIETVNRYQKDHGKVATGIDDEGLQINFFVPKDILDKVNNKMTIEEATDFLMGIAWGRNWALGMAKAVYGPTRWGALPEGEKESVMKDLVRRKLAPSLLPL